MSKELIHARSDAFSQRRQYECVKELLSSTMAEMAVMYDVSPPFKDLTSQVVTFVNSPSMRSWTKSSTRFSYLKMTLGRLLRKISMLRRWTSRHWRGRIGTSVLTNFLLSSLTLLCRQLQVRLAEEEAKSQA